MKFETRVQREAPMVLVEWIDSQSDSGGWQYFDSNDVTQNQMRSIGWMVESDAEKVSIIPHLGLDVTGLPSQMRGRLVIPQRAIARIVRLAEVLENNNGAS